MTLKSQMAADSAVFFNINEFAEWGKFNGSPIKIIVERGITVANGNIISNEGHTDQGVIRVSTTDIPAPKSGMEITDKDGVIWRVQRVLESDEIMHSLACINTSTSSYYGGR